MPCCCLIVSLLLDAVVVFHVLIDWYGVLFCFSCFGRSVGMKISHFLGFLMLSLLCKYKIGTWKQEIAVLHAFAPNSHQNGKLLSQTSCKEEIGRASCRERV